jgi:heme oxygenase (mycobilin-producing)
MEASELEVTSMSGTRQAFRVLLRFHIHPGMERDFERTWLEIADVVTNHPANLEQWLMRSAEEPGIYYIISDWADEAGFRQFEGSDAHVGHRTRLHPFRSSGSMTTMQVVHHLRHQAVLAG